MNNELDGWARRWSCTNVRHCCVFLEEAMQTEFCQVSFSGPRFEPDPIPLPPNTKQECNHFHHVVFATIINLFPPVVRIFCSIVSVLRVTCSVSWFWDATHTFRVTDIHYTGCSSLSYSSRFSLHTVLHFSIQPQLTTIQCGTVSRTFPPVTMHCVQVALSQVFQCTVHMCSNYSFITKLNNCDLLLLSFVLWIMSFGYLKFVINRLIYHVQI